MAYARILLVDDHQEMRDLVVRLLEKDFEVVQAVGDGRSFLEAATRLNPDLCLVDISIPVINGIRAVIRLREAGSTAKIIFLTIHEDADFVREAFKSGASGYVVKSQLASDLRTAVNEVLSGRTFVSSSLNYNPIGN